jgi:hypothetical protein
LCKNTTRVMALENEHTRVAGRCPPAPRHAEVHVREGLTTMHAPAPSAECSDNSCGLVRARSRTRLRLPARRLSSSITGAGATHDYDLGSLSRRAQTPAAQRAHEKDAARRLEAAASVLAGQSLLRVLSRSVRAGLRLREPPWKRAPLTLDHFGPPKLLSALCKLSGGPAVSFWSSNSVSSCRLCCADGEV